MLVTVDGTTRRGKRVPMKEIADAAVALVASRQACLVDRATTAAMSPCRPERDHDWAESRQGRCRAVPTVACDPNDPLMIIYTSGTTGAPKGIVHTHVGYLLKAGIDFGYAFDIQPDDRLGWIADMGWMLGPLMIVGGLQFGAAIVLIEGLPNFPTTDRLWQIVERNRVTLLGIAPTAARGLRAAHGRRGAVRGPFQPARLRLDRRGLGRSDLALAVRDGRQRSACRSSTTRAAPRPAAASCRATRSRRSRRPPSAGPLPGMDVDVLDADGKPTTGIGELVRPQHLAGHDARLLARSRPLSRHVLEPLARHLGARRPGQRRRRWLLAHSRPLGRHDQDRAAAASARRRSSRRWSRNPAGRRGRRHRRARRDEGLSASSPSSSLRTDARGLRRRRADRPRSRKLLGKAMAPSRGRSWSRACPRPRTARSCAARSAPATSAKPLGDLSALEPLTPLDLIPVQS